MWAPEAKKMTIARNSAIVGDTGNGSATTWSSGAHFLPQTKYRTIMFVTNTGEYGGAEKHLLELVRRLMESGVHLSILCLAEDLYSEHLSQDETTRIDITRCQGKLKSFRDWYRVFRDNRPDTVVFVRAWLWCYPWYAPLAAWLAGVSRRVSIAHLQPPPFTVVLEGNSIRQFILRARRIAHLWSLRTSVYFEHAIICVSNTIRDSLVKEYRFSLNKTMTIHNGVSLPESASMQSNRTAVRSRLGLNPQEFLLVCVARLSEQKRIDILLLAIAQLIRDGVPCKCVIVGDGPLREKLAERHVSLGLTAHVIFEGFQEDTLPYLQAGTAFVLTSDREGLPLALLEAMACGLPCIVTGVGGNVEAVTDRVHGLVVPAGSVSDVAAAISFLVAHPRERAKMALTARDRVHAEFDIEKCMAELKRVILGKGHRAERQSGTQEAEHVERA
jgi:glycosyltransferase involved in cell wall biosynthesis